MFQSNLLKGALCALALLDLSAATSPEDVAAYPDFANTMAIEGFNYQWESF